MGASVSALVLPVEACSSGEAQVIAGIPGRWEPGVAYTPEAVGMTLAEARRAIADADLPLVVEKVSAEEARSEFERVNHATGAESEPVEAEPEPEPESPPAADAPAGSDG